MEAAMLHEAMLWERLGPDDERVRCDLCSHHCVILPGHQGVCHVRENRGGTLYTLVYGEVIAQHVDPIEKKPLFHFYPGSRAYSIATPGCNFRCAFCQNWEISQMPRERAAVHGQPASPAQIAAAAQAAGCASVAYTYTEPTIFAEYALDTAREAQALGLKNVFVSNGYMTPALLDRMAGLIDAINVDLKAGRGEFYHKISGAALEPVLANLKRIQQLGIWLEVTTLVIPGLNDSDDELRWMATYLHDELGPDVPWHVSRFYPNYQMADALPTPTAALSRAWDIGHDVGLRYVYVGNLPSNQTENTFCPQCGALVISRLGFRVRQNALRAGACAACGTTISGVGLDG
jgi:pyruvate formate lyase activating enzyme